MTFLCGIMIGLSAICCAALVTVLRPICIRYGHYDSPGGRKRHGKPTPLSGGIAIIITVLLLGAVFEFSTRFMGFACGALLLGVLGATDDRKHVPAYIRLTLQAAAVIIGMYWLGGVRLDSLGSIAGSENLELGSFALPFTVFAAVGVINAVNMVDGMDGLAGGFSALVLFSLLLVSFGGVAPNTLLSCLMLGSVLGFLMFNLRFPWQRRARIFLGDAGSLVLGFSLVWFAVDASQGPTASIRPITAVWLFGLPLIDACYLMGSRKLKGKSPLAADRYHFHHLLQRSGMGPQKALLVWMMVAGAFAGIGLALQAMAIPDFISCVSFLALFAGYCVLATRVWRRRAVRRCYPKNLDMDR